MRWVVLFENTREAICAEQAMRKAGIQGLAVPVPRWSSSQCGIALDIDESDKVAMEAVLRELGGVGRIVPRQEDLAASDRARSR